MEENKKNEYVFRFPSFKEIVKNFRIKMIQTFLVPVTVSKCEHEFKIIHFAQYRIGKSKYSITTHKCNKCKLVKKYNTKY